MKLNPIPKPARWIFVAGLVLTSLTPILSRYLHLPDLVRGFLQGFGLMLEVIAIIKIQRTKKNVTCAFTGE